MNSKNIISITEARKRLFQIADDVQVPDTHYVLTENGRPKVVLMSVEQFESWEETIEVATEFPNLLKDAKDAERDYQNGDYVTLEEILAKEGFVLADKGKKKYGISSNRSQKNKKRNI